MDAGTPRVVFDPLYGQQELPELIASAFQLPELQRLRHVRLSNIDSASLTGISGVTRFEHSVGTALLAGIVASSLGLGGRDTAVLVLAALLHDASITPFGHLMEEGFLYAGMIFSHEKAFRQVLRGDVGIGNRNTPIYRGRGPLLMKLLRTKALRDLNISIDDVLEAKIGRGGFLGSLVAGQIDVDNIDNVCRVALHLGLDFPRQLPVQLARGFFLRSGVLCINDDCVPMLRAWGDLRYRVYNVLMTNRADFVGKAMMVEACRRALVGHGPERPILHEDDWILTDTELLSRLDAYGPTHDLIDRWLTGRAYPLVGPFWIDSTGNRADLRSAPILETLRHRVAAGAETTPDQILPYVIKDKRQRRIDSLSVCSRTGAESPRDLVIGEQPTEMLVGVAVGGADIPLSRVEFALLQVLDELTGPAQPRACIEYVNRNDRSTAGQPEHTTLFGQDP